MFGICGSFVEASVTLDPAVLLCLKSRPLSEARLEVTADPLLDEECIDAMVFILALLPFEVREVPLLVVLRIEVRVPLGESVMLLLFSPVGGGRGSLRLSQPCLRAALGVIRVPGSHSRHRLIKSRNMGSSQPLSAVWSSREPGGPRGLPRRDRPPLRTVVPSGSVVTVQYLGYPGIRIVSHYWFDNSLSHTTCVVMREYFILGR